MRMCKPLALEGRGVGERVSFRHKSESFDFQTFKFKMDSRFRKDDGVEFQHFTLSLALSPRGRGDKTARMTVVMKWRGSRRFNVKSMQMPPLFD